MIEAGFDPWARAMLSYKGYSGDVGFDSDAGVFHGEVLDTRDVITFEGTTVEELEEAFRASVDDYLEFCDERGEEPDKPFSGRLMVRLSAVLHRRLFVEARRSGKSLNQLISDRLSHATRQCATVDTGSCHGPCDAQTTTRTARATSALRAERRCR